MPSTSRGFRYPSGSDSPNVAQYIQNLANDVDAAWAKVNGPELVTPVSATLQAGWTSVISPTCGYIGSRMVRVAGQVTNNSSYNPTSAAAHVITLPVGYRPANARVGVVGLFSAAPTTLLAEVRTDGRIFVFHSGNVSVPVGQQHYFDSLYFYLD